MTLEDEQFADALIKDLRYFDTARRWLQGLKKRRGAKENMLADVDSRMLDILQAEGKRKEYDKAVEAFKKAYPWHPRASLGSLELIGGRLGAIIDALDKAKRETDEKKAAEQRAGAKKRFVDEVEKPFDALIESLGKATSSDGGKTEIPEKVRQRNHAELTRIRVYRVYAEALAEDDADRKRYLEKGLKLVDVYVDERYDFYIMQFDAQVEKGLFLLALERYEEAASELDLILEAEPPTRGPYPAPLAKEFHKLRLKAALFSARALNAAKRSDKAAQLLKYNIFRRPRVQLDVDIDKVETDVDLRQFAVLTRLEYGIALAASGDPKAGMAQIHAVISKYEGSDDPKAKAFVIDARSAMGRIWSSGNVQLAGMDYYQVGIGLKAALQFEDALEAFQKALATLTPRELAKNAPLVLNEMGEVCFYLERFDEAALAYDELTRYYRGAANYKKGANNFPGMVAKAKQELGAASTTHVGFKELTERADKVLEAAGGRSDIRRSRLFNEGAQREEQGDWAGARSVYEQIEKEEDDPAALADFYRARALIGSTYLREWQRVTREDRKAKLREEFPKVIAELEANLPDALKIADKGTGAAVTALTLGELYFNTGEHDKAVAALKHFTEELANDQFYRCSGLGYLIVNAVRAGQVEGAPAWFSELVKSCSDDPAVPAAAWELSEDAGGRGDSKRAAFYMLQYADHPNTKASLDNLPLVMRIVSVLLEGGLITDARRYVDVAKNIESAEAGDLERQLVFVDAKIALASKDYDGAIVSLLKYVKEYEVRGAEPEDAYVAQMLGKASIARAKVRGKGKVGSGTLQKAEKYYGHAARLLKARVAQPKPPAPPSVVRDYWRTAYRYLEVKGALARRGDQDAYEEINMFCNENRYRIEASGFGKSFLKIWNRAREKIGKKPIVFSKNGSKNGAKDAK